MEAIGHLDYQALFIPSDLKMFRTSVNVEPWMRHIEKQHPCVNGTE
jgi:hypothetical protein